LGQHNGGLYAARFQTLDAPSRYRYSAAILRKPPATTALPHYGSVLSGTRTRGIAVRTNRWDRAPDDDSS